MHPFPPILTAIAAPLPMDNIDTDTIIPKQFLKTIRRTGLKDGLFYDMRYDVNGKKNNGFVLHRAPYDKAQILISGANFGCGSSREHAPWALLDFGIRCVIAPSFADIFFNNCFKNGILPLVLPREDTDALIKYASESANPTLTVDLEKQTVSSYHFVIDPFRKKCLLEGLDDIALTLQYTADISAFEARQRQECPWLY